MTTPNFIPCPDATKLRALIAPWLDADPAPYVLICGVAERMADDGWCGVITAAGEPILAVVQTPPHPVLVASPHPVDAEIVRMTTGLFSSEGRVVRGVNGPEEWAEAIAAAQARTIVHRMGLRLHRLVGPAQAPSSPTGAARCFHPAETALLQDWLRAFDDEIVTPGEPHSFPSLAQVEAIRSNCLAWTVDERPVSMARNTRPLLGGWNISSVYTPPELRGRGYAGAVVHALSARLVAKGARYVVLYTDLANPISNRLYARIGFVPVLDQTRLIWESP